jgi:hypothetical protein
LSVCRHKPLAASKNYYRIGGRLEIRVDSVKVVAFIVLCFIALISCAPGGAAFEFYVVVKPEETGRLIGAVTSIAKEDGLETAVGQATSDSGNVLRVVEGRRGNLKLWVQNIPLSAREDPKLCGVHPEAYVDPAQFVISTEPRFFGFKSNRTAAIELGKRVLLQLQKLGFDVRQEPVVCGAAAIRDRP